MYTPWMGQACVEAAKSKPASGSTQIYL